MTEKNPISELSLHDLARMLGISAETARQLGKKALLNQILNRFGQPTTRCEDASGAGYTGDLEADLEPVLKNRETKRFW